MRLIEYESKIKSLIQKDRKDPQIYVYLQEMLYMFLLRKKVSSRSEIEEVSYTFAGDLFLSISSGVEINYFLGYIEKKYKEYFKEYFRENRFSQPYDPAFDEIREEERSICDDFDKVLDRVYLQNSSGVICQMMDNCKYTDPSVVSNLTISLYLSLIKGSLTNFHLSEDQFSYLRILLVVFYNKVKSGG